jgi:L-asparaginase
MKQHPKIKFFAVGGTIDKVYFDHLSTYKVGEPGVSDILREANVSFEYDCESILRKDSLNMTEKDRQTVFELVAAEKARHIVITHGTDTMVKTEKRLKGIKERSSYSRAPCSRPCSSQRMPSST